MYCLCTSLVSLVHCLLSLCHRHFFFVSVFVAVVVDDVYNFPFRLIIDSTHVHNRYKYWRVQWEWISLREENGRKKNNKKQCMGQGKREKRATTIICNKFFVMKIKWQQTFFFYAPSLSVDAHLGWDTHENTNAPYHFIAFLVEKTICALFYYWPHRRRLGWLVMLTATIADCSRLGFFFFIRLVCAGARYLM